MVQLGPLAGGSRHRGEPIAAVLDAAMQDAALLAAHGVDAVTVQNLAGQPFGAASVAVLFGAATALLVRLPQPTGAAAALAGTDPLCGHPAGPGRGRRPHHAAARAAPGAAFWNLKEMTR